MNWYGKEGILIVKSVKESTDQEGRDVAWISGTAEISTPGSGSEFMKFDLTVKGFGHKKYKKGDTIKIKNYGKFWVPTPNTESMVHYVDENPCNGVCIKCKDVGKDGFCTRTG